MNTLNRHRRLWSGILLAAFLVPLMASLAEAGSRHRRYRGPVHRTRVVRTVECAPRWTYRAHRSDVGPALVGFVGGLVLGAAVAHAGPPVQDHGYWDPYCERGFASLDVYDDHCRGYRHGHSYHVIQVPAGYDWNDRRWCDDCSSNYWGDHDCD